MNHPQHGKAHLFSGDLDHIERVGELFTVYLRIDRGMDGGGWPNVVGVFSTKAKAECSFMVVEEREAVRLSDGSVRVLDRMARVDIDGKELEAKERARSKALAKLTDEEREALGLK